MAGPLTVTVTGTFDPTNVATVGKAVGGSGVAFNNVGANAFDARTSTQRSINLFSECNAFVSGLSAAIGVPPFVIIDQVVNCLEDMRRNPSMGERAYSS